MIRLNSAERQTTASAIKEALGLAIAPDTIQGIEIHEVGEAATVIVVTPTSLHAIGKDYFRELVAKYKVSAPVATESKTTTTTIKPLSYRQQVMQRCTKLFGYEVKSKKDLKHAIINRGNVSFMEAVNLERSGNDFYRAAEEAINRMTTPVKGEERAIALP